jgi:hypothetical protein
MSSGRDVGLKRANLRPKPVNVQCRWYQIEMPLLKIVDLQIASQLPTMP